MPKRSRKEASDEKLLRRIEKLERKLSKRRKTSPTPSRQATTPPPTTPPLPDPGPEDCILVEEIDTGEEEEISPEIISALGVVKELKDYGDELHPEIIKRIHSIITGGMQSDSKVDVLKRYNTPKNLTLLDAPKLNGELEAILSEPIKARDKRVEERQQQLGTALAAVLSVTHDLIKKEGNPVKMICTLTDAARLLGDLHYEDTITRRKLVSQNLDKNISKSVENTTRDAYLFGEKFNDNIKAASALKKSAAVWLLKPNNKKVSQPVKKQENFRAPPRQNFKQMGGGGRYQRVPTYQRNQASVRPQQQRQQQMKQYRQRPVRQT